MKITELDIFPLSVPYIPPIQKYVPEGNWGRPTIVRVHTDEGIDGIGGGWNEHVLTPRRNLEEEFSKLKGKNPLKLNLMNVPHPFNVALYDIVGKALKVPASYLLGGRVRDRVPVAYWVMSQATPEETAAEAVVAVKKGFTALKFHTSRESPTVERVKATHEAVGDKLALRIDRGAGWDLRQTLKVARQIADYNIECFEEPLPLTGETLKGRNPELYRLLRTKIDIPLALHIGPDATEVLRAVKNEACDYFNVHPSWDDLHDCLTAAAVAEAAGAPVWTAAPALAIGIHYIFGLHYASVINNATLPADTAFLMEEDFVKEPLPPVIEGLTEVPKKPGLGITLDEDAVEKYLIRD
jgi:L-alanine-DL-glutamate epimerase-like enolase superfamily enzyme